MGVVKKETLTRREPDGTLVTTTTKTKTETLTERELEWGVEAAGPFRCRYLATPAAIIRFLQIIVGLVIISLISAVYGTGPFKSVLFGQTFLLIFTGVCICLTCIILVVLFLTLHNTHLSFWPWRQFCLALSVIGALVFLFCGFMEAYYASGAWANNCNRTGSDGLLHSRCRTITEWAFASAFCFINAILYFVTAFFAFNDKYFD